MSQNGAKVRSAEEEAALDKKIAEIRKKNEEISRRKEEIDKDIASFNTEVGGSRRSPPKESSKAEHKKSSPSKNSKGNDWDREWDTGKTSADTWKENVPEMGVTSRGGYVGSGHSPRGGRGGRGRPQPTPRSQFTLHDDRSEPKDTTDRNTASTDSSRGRGSMHNETTHRGKPNDRRQPPSGIKGPHGDQHKRDGKPGDRRSYPNAEETKPRRDGEDSRAKRDPERRAARDDMNWRETAERNGRGRGRGAGSLRGRVGRASDELPPNNDSKTTGSSKRFSENKRASKTIAKTSSDKKETDIAKGRLATPTDNGDHNREESQVVKQVLDELVEKVV